MVAAGALIVGGPAGLTPAITAPARGIDALVLDYNHPPIDKPGGEGLMPEGVRLRGARSDGGRRQAVILVRAGEACALAGERSKPTTSMRKPSPRFISSS